MRLSSRSTQHKDPGTNARKVRYTLLRFLKELLRSRRVNTAKENSVKAIAVNARVDFVESFIITLN